MSAVSLAEVPDIGIWGLGPAIWNLGTSIAASQWCNRPYACGRFFFSRASGTGEPAKALTEEWAP